MPTLMTSLLYESCAEIPFSTGLCPWVYAPFYWWAPLDPIGPEPRTNTSPQPTRLHSAGQWKQIKEMHRTNAHLVMFVKEQRLTQGDNDIVWSRTLCSVFLLFLACISLKWKVLLNFSLSVCLSTCMYYIRILGAYRGLEWNGVTYWIIGFGWCWKEAKTVRELTEQNKTGEERQQ